MAVAAHLVVPRPFFFATKVNVSKRQNLGRLTALLILLIAALVSPAFSAGRTAGPSDAADKVSEKISDIDFAKSPAENWVICIGINSYEDDRLPTLKFCENDARLVRDYFISKHGIKPEHAILMATSQSDPALSPTRVNINNTIKDVLAQASPDSMIVVYIASHGVTGAAPDRQRVAYLIPTDGDIEDLNGTALNLTQMNDYMQKGKADTTLLIADACRTPVDKKKGTRSAKGDADVDAAPKNKGHYFISSCSDSQVAYEMEDVKHGAFTHFLMEGLNGEAGDKNGQVTLPGLISYVKCNLREWAQRNGKQVMEPFINVNSWSGRAACPRFLPDYSSRLGQDLIGNR